MKKHLFTFLSFLVLLFTTSSIKASHLAYADLTYKSIAGGSYELTLSIYSICFSIPIAPPSTAQIEYCSVSKGKFGNVILNETIKGGVPVFPPCSYPSSFCVGGTSPGYIKSVYKGIFTPPVASNDWLLAFKECCRHFSITTLDLTAGNDFAVVVNIDNVKYPGDNSPVFKNEPVAFACCGLLVGYDQSATDADGDSLSYSLYTPLALVLNPTCTSATTVVYKSPYTPSDPISSTPSININPKTGLLTMKPTLCSERGVIGIRVDEYRKKVLIGSILRETTIDFTPFTLSAPQVLIEEDKPLLSPNPLHDKLSITGMKNDFQMQIFNLTGVKVYEQFCQSSNHEFDLSKLSAGVYFVHIQTQNNTVKTKIVKL